MAVKINGFIEGTQLEELMKLLLSLDSNWGDGFDTRKIKARHLSGAMTNVVYRITWPQNNENNDRTVLVRSMVKARDFLVIFLKGQIFSLTAKRKSEILSLFRPMGMARDFLVIFLEAELRSLFIHAKNAIFMDLVGYFNHGNQDNPTSFGKTLTQSDANNGGGFSV